MTREADFHECKLAGFRLSNRLKQCALVFEHGWTVLLRLSARLCWTC